MDGPGVASPFVIRDLARSDLAEVVRIDALHTGARKPAHWSRVFKDMFSPRGGPLRFGLAAREQGRDGRPAPPLSESLARLPAYALIARRYRRDGEPGGVGPG